MTVSPMTIVVALPVPPRQSMLQKDTSLVRQQSFAGRSVFPFPSVHDAEVFAQHERREILKRGRGKPAPYLKPPQPHDRSGRRKIRPLSPAGTG
ncbi:hypothetical protein IG631_00285 [Alternaria alternata]|nr:hypothetical protein IG631_00285 [Alternaria alternata]